MTGHRVPHVPAGYELLTPLGAGRTGYVYRARHARFGDVALKLPRAEIAGKPDLRRMFENEVQLTLGLRHGNVVTGFEGSPTGPHAFLALEFCPNGTIADLLSAAGGSLALDSARNLVYGVALGLEHVHQRQVLHRDIKPANVFIGRDGTAKLGDFGTGIHVGQESDGRVGTPFYMAPEIFEGKPSSVQSDIYSLGVLAYEVFSGQRPFLGSSYDDLMMAHLSGLPKALGHQRSDISRHEVRVITSAMARNPEARFRTVAEFRTAFAAAAGIDERERRGEQVTGRASRRPAGRGGAADVGEEERAGNGGGLLGWFRRRRGD